MTFVRTKVTKRRWGDPRPPLFIQSVCIEADTAQPPNYHTLRASDLRRVSGRTSAVALLKGQANLIFCVGPPAPIEPCTGFRHQKTEMSLSPRAVRRSAQRTAPITRGQRPCGDSVATGFLPCRRPIGQKRGPGRPRRRFGYFAAEGKVTRAGARNTPKQPEGLIKGDSEDPSSDTPLAAGLRQQIISSWREPLLPYCPPTWTNRTLDAETTRFFCGNLSTFFLSAVEMFPDCVILNLYGKIMGKKFPFSEVSLWQKS